MFIIRPIRETDLTSLVAFAKNTAIGMLSLPPDKKRLEEKIIKSLESFDKLVKNPENQIYLFVLENLKTGEIGGCCGIYAKLGPLFVFQIISQPTSAHENRFLKPYNDEISGSELCSLYIQNEWREHKLGSLLSLSRFLFIHNFPERFESHLYARLRGLINKKTKTSPFWNGVGKRFIDISFQKAINMQLKGDPFIFKYLPQTSIPVALLSKTARESIGAVHDTTQPAQFMLMRQGFKETSFIDAFEGGPVLSCSTLEADAIKNAVKYTLKGFSNNALTGDKQLLSNTTLDFRCCLDTVQIQNKEAIITKEAGDALNLSPGDSILVYRLRV